MQKSNQWQWYQPRSVCIDSVGWSGFILFAYEFSLLFTEHIYICHIFTFSGVATYCKDHVTPEKAEEGLSDILSSGNTGKIGHYGNHSTFTDDEIVALDAEGRAILTQHKIK